MSHRRGNHTWMEVQTEPSGEQQGQQLTEYEVQLKLENEAIVTQGYSTQSLLSARTAI